MTDLQACLGGWCKLRERCPNYHADDRRSPRERLCERGIDGYRSDAPMVFVRPVDRPGLVSSKREEAAA